ncbi:MAG TPA: alpha-hydroxy acid oxidase [Solirubrobacteraceae bacterium]|jgi:4-hydroxymandelate oxidase
MELLRRLEAEARARLTDACFDFFAGGAGDEQTLAENVLAWRKVWLRPRVMVDVTEIDMTCALLGERLGLPVLLAPMSTQRLLHPDGEVACASAAGSAGSIYCLATRATADLAEVAAAATGPLWFQLYLERGRSVAERVLARAAEHGFSAVLLSVDRSVGGRRERELRHGELPLPPGVSLAAHLGDEEAPPAQPLAEWELSLTWADVAWARQASGLPVLVKGILTALDAIAAIHAGAEAIIVSNHGGRQLDGCVPSAVALREIAAAVAGRVPVLVDGGIRDGGDVVRALALGASAVLIGRPYAWGLAAAGEAGVRSVLDAFRADLRRTLALCGCATLADVTPDHVRLADW